MDVIVRESFVVGDVDCFFCSLLMIYGLWCASTNTIFCGERVSLPYKFCAIAIFTVSCVSHSKSDGRLYYILSEGEIRVRMGRNQKIKRWYSTCITRQPIITFAAIKSSASLSLGVIVHPKTPGELSCRFFFVR
jgi:hypothetical protein